MTTPTPWTVREPNGRGRGWSAGPAWLGERPWSDETAADARLISAAPELLQALRNLSEAVSRSRSLDVPGSVMTAARAAIEKATGSTP